MKIFVNAIEAEKASSLYSAAEMDSLGYENDWDFDRDFVVISFRVDTEKQAFPIRIRLKKVDVPEDDWIRYARKEAQQLIAEIAGKWKAD